MNDKLNELISYFKNLGKVAIAFSGGVDSTFLAYVAYSALGEEAVAITVDSPYIPRWELEEAKTLAAQIWIRHEIITIALPKIIENNPANRCYLCKTIVFKTILDKAIELGVKYVSDGSNYDDLSDYRPGMVALKELEIKSPLLECGWTKDMIRSASKEADLATHDKPAYACLLTRIPYDSEINMEILERIEKSEVYMMSKGFRAIRVRAHDDLARIEVATHERHRLFDEKLLDEISTTLKSFGFTYVTIEASGYKMGSFNQQINQ